MRERVREKERGRESERESEKKREWKRGEGRARGKLTVYFSVRVSLQPLYYAGVAVQTTLSQLVHIFNHVHVVLYVINTQYERPFYRKLNMLTLIFAMRYQDI